MAADELQQIFQSIQGGASKELGQIIQFPVNAAGASAAGKLAGEGVKEVVQMGNGAATTVSQLTTTAAGAATATATGLAVLSMPVTGATIAVATALGLVGGVNTGMWLYNLSPQFWADLNNSLDAAGQMVGDKIRMFLNCNGNDPLAGLSEPSIEIIKQALFNEGLFDSTGPLYPENFPSGHPSLGKVYPQPLKYTNANNQQLLYSSYLGKYCYTAYGNNTSEVYTTVLIENDSDPDFSVVMLSLNTFVSNCSFGGSAPVPSNAALQYSVNGVNFYGRVYSFWTRGYTQGQINPIVMLYNAPFPLNYENMFMYDCADMIFRGTTPSQYVQPGAVTPTQDPFQQTYTTWQPWQAPQDVPWPSELPNIYPIELPANNPDATQQQAQNPSTITNPDSVLDFLLDALINPDPIIEPVPEPVPIPDPDPVPVPLPLPVIDGVRPEPDPPDPNKPIPPSPIPIIPDLPTTVDSNAMFTVYAPSISQLNAFGGWLWSNNIIDMLLRIWQDPLEGIIAFQKVYAVPTVGSSSNIIVGYVDSQVSAPVVTSQFVTVNCGTLTVDEILNNATDYPPYTTMHIYLPFIGIVELDSNEFMNGSITVTYHIDVYTGTCLVEVASTRSPDMASPTIIYTFSGNASQQLPLTSSNFGGALNALVSTVSGVARMGTGGMINKVSGAAQIGHSLAHEMIHIAHSGDLSANAGIMALRTPYLIIGRRNSYDANFYSEMYGYPCNKTVFLGNCTGFTRVKAGRLRTKATENEKKEIMSLLEKGVIM